jgi:predicted DCC family thiol-disulfide oxidoreductase YuxK
MNSTAFIIHCEEELRKAMMMKRILPFFSFYMLSMAWLTNGFQASHLGSGRQSPPKRLSSFIVSSTTIVQNEDQPVAAMRERMELQYPVILYDGVCNFCNTWVDILLRLDKNKRYKFAALQSEFGMRLLEAVGKEKNDISSVVLVEPDLQYYDKSACVLRVVEELGPIARLGSNMAARLVPEPLRDSIYDMVAENRYSLMGKREICRCGDPKYSDRFLN